MIDQCIEDIVLDHSNRGMDKIRQHLPLHFCEDAAQEISSWNKGKVLLVTGFYVEGHPETDGPIGTVTLAEALKICGLKPVVLAEGRLVEYFSDHGLRTVQVSPEMTEADYAKIIEAYDPVGIISIERCGRTSSGAYINSQGHNIDQYTSSVDWLFLQAQGKIPTIAIGDSGNEIGMGCVAPFLSDELGVEPCVVKADRLVVGTVSNWAAYGIIAYLQKIMDVPLLPTFMEAHRTLHRLVDFGGIDGVTQEHTVTIDGFTPADEEEVLNRLHDLLDSPRDAA